MFRAVVLLGLLHTLVGYQQQPAAQPAGYEQPPQAQPLQDQTYNQQQDAPPTGYDQAAAQPTGYGQAAAQPAQTVARYDPMPFKWGPPVISNPFYVSINLI
ncbi:hypothetical protein Q1695_001327 [Nippostrongylus brasiliensis]|nr:hypothetical protein Q1695_001327 [Nippostrongylus brasiliensis]